MRSRWTLAVLLVCLLAAAVPRPAACRALSRALPQLPARRLVAAGGASDAAPSVRNRRAHAGVTRANAARAVAQGGSATPPLKYDRSAFHVHIPVWLIVLIVLTACCILSGSCVAAHSQFVRAPPTLHRTSLRSAAIRFAA